MQQSQPLSDLGNKNVSDLISSDTSINWSGTSGAVTGTLNYIQNWEEFSSNPSEQTGNFFPLKLDNKYLGQNISVCRNGGTEKVAADLEWVLRVPGQNTIYVFKANGVEIFTLSFATATLATN